MHEANVIEQQKEIENETDFSTSSHTQKVTSDKNAMDGKTSWTALSINLT